ncbi:protein-tyrosine-phosphatase [Pleurotus pulmonarius]
MVYNPQSVNAIIKDQLYLGNLAAAQSLDLRKKIGITHIVSVCPEYPSTGPNHLAIAVHDSEYENLLIHLPNACRFIQAAMDNGGKVLVHCVMGISRSTTVVCAYLMKTRRMSPSSAIRFVRRWRPCVHPNYGFVRQLHAFADCGYDPSPDNKAYIAWKRTQSRNVTKFLKTVVDTTPVIPEQLYLSSDFPKDPEQAEALLLDLGITHFLTLSPAECEICDFINDAITNDGEVLIYSVVESRACTAACAYLMSSRHIHPDAAYSLLQNALPLFNPTANFSKHLELFDACRYHPTAEHPLVRAWSGNDKPKTRKASSPTRSGDPKDLNTNATALSAAAACMLSETGFDMVAFGETLAKIQRQHLV